MKFTSSYLLSSIYNLNFNSNLSASAYANHTFKISIGESSQKRYHSDKKASKISENPAGISERSAENSQKAKDKTVQVFSKYGSDTQFDMIKTFVEEEGSLPSFEKWMELRQNVLSSKGTLLDVLITNYFQIFFHKCSVVTVELVVIHITECKLQKQISVKCILGCSKGD